MISRGTEVTYVAKVELLPPPKICFFGSMWKPFKIDENCFLFHLKLPNILPNISRSKYNQTMKFCQLMEYTKRGTFFFKNHAENEAGRLVSDHFFFF